MEWRDDNDTLIKALTSQENKATDIDDESEDVEEAVDPRAPFDDARRLFAEHDFERDGPCYHLLQPSLFKTFLVRGDLAVADARVILPAIWRSIMLRRTWRSLTEVIEGVEITQQKISSTIPRYKMTNIEVRYPKKVQEEHDGYYFPLVKQLNSKRAAGEKSASLSDGLPETSSESQGRINWMLSDISPSWH
jgi:hypothetical protein